MILSREAYLSQIAEKVRVIADALAKTETGRVTSLSAAPLAVSTYETIGQPVRVNDITKYSEYGITDTGSYAFVRIKAQAGISVTNETTVEGASGYIAVVGEDHIDVAIRFDVAAKSKIVTINWGGQAETFIFKATDLAVDNLDYLVTYYVYDAEDEGYVKWEYALATDATFDAAKHYWVKSGDTYTAAEVTAGDTVPAVYYEDAYTLTDDAAFADGKTYYTEEEGIYTAVEVTTGEAVTADAYYEHSYMPTEDAAFADGKAYYTKDGDVYTAAEITAGDAVPAAYYVHSKVTFEGMARNISYVLNTAIDCPMTFILPEIDNETHGCWFDITMLCDGAYSMTLIPPDGVKVATEHTQQEQKGINRINLQYSSAAGTKIWRFMNTRSTVPA